VALIGVGTPLSLAAAEGHAFATIFAAASLQMALGAVLERTGAAPRVSEIAGLARRMPITAILIWGAALAIAGVPGSALYATQAVALEAAAQWDATWLWALGFSASAALFAGVALRVGLAMHQPVAKPAAFAEAPFTMMLGAALALFFCVSIGLAPQWLYGLMPAGLAFDPFSLSRLAPQMEALGAAGAAYVVLRWAGLAPRPRRVNLLDLDALYRGPLASSGRWAGVLMLRVYGAWQVSAARLSSRTGEAAERVARRCDQPYAAGLAGAAQFAVFAAMLLMMLFLA
jgi:multicomponent Na+:H+ antiporter subunit D